MKCDELKYERLGDAFNDYPDSTLVIRKQYVDAAIAELKTKLEDEREFGLNQAKNADYEIGKLNEKIIVLKKSYKKLVKKFVHEISVAESYRSLIYKEDALKYQEVGNSEMYEELSKKSDNAYRHANRWRRIFRKLSQEADK